VKRLNVPGWRIPIRRELAPAIEQRSGGYQAEVLGGGAILRTGQRRVSAALRVMGLSGERKDVQDDPVLRRAKGSGWAGGLIVLKVLLKPLMREAGVLKFGMAERRERRGGEKIAARAI
jgi:hypothetical protein